ncbi:DUF6702 family protein [Eudoraea sp.]|uniref:DUF6702 family protein n=1 Tax=Eudoraea sp. TaxID=1979955 RepID=UPI003C710F94
MRLIVSWLWLLIPIVILGHSPSQSSALLIEGANGQWTLQIRAALTAFEHVVHEEYTADGYSTPKEFEELVLNLLSRNLRLHFDGEEVNLIDPMLRLGHETLVVYQVDAPDNFQTLDMKNSIFQDIFNSTSAFMVLKSGIKNDFFILEKDNNYSVSLKLENGVFELQNKPDNTVSISVIGLFLFAFVLILLAISLVAGLKPIQSVNV